ncbi:MAG: GNAT family N-acetyltransferase [Syntrophothermus sp.]
MIRKLAPNDIPEVMGFLMEESSFNLFIIGDIENFGIETDFQTVWGEFDEQRLVAVMLRYFDSYVLYAKAPYDATGFGEIIRRSGNGGLLSGKADVVAQMEEPLQLDETKKRSTYFCTLRRLDQLESAAAESWATGNEFHVKRASEADVGRILALYKLIKEFGAPSSREMLAKSLATHAGRCYFVEDDAGNIISMAQSTAENSRSAMIVGVATHPGQRKKGLASVCVAKLCHDLLVEGKEACLFYSNPEAGRIYKRLGFQDIGMWSMYTLSLEETGHYRSLK